MNIGVILKVTSYVATFVAGYAFGFRVGEESEKEEIFLEERTYPNGSKNIEQISKEEYMRKTDYLRPRDGGVPHKRLKRRYVWKERPFTKEIYDRWENV